MFRKHRKAEHSNVSIHLQSPHPASHKVATINSAIHRMLSILLDPDAEEAETKQIEAIAKINGLIELE